MFKLKHISIVVISTIIFLTTLCCKAVETVSLPAITTISAAASNAEKMPNLIPAQPDLNVKAYILIDAKSGNVIAAKNEDTQLPPASITKVMSLYLIADALKNNKIKPTDLVPISERAWRMEGSRMFAKVGSEVPVQQLIDGIIIASGNDATVAMAEYLGGTEDAFVNLMNQTATRLGMKNTNFADSNGLPAMHHYSSARDISILARAWINNFPEYYPWFKTKWIVYNNIKQPNRNRLLWRDPSADGIKTGHTSEAGYCLAASAVRNNMRLIAVVLGAPSDSARANYTESLLNYGFRFFESHKVYAANTPLLTPKVKSGKEKISALGLAEDLYVTAPLGQYKNVKIDANLDTKLVAPILKGKPYGALNITLNNRPIATRSLIALEDNPVGGLWDRFIRIFGL